MHPVASQRRAWRCHPCLSASLVSGRRSGDTPRRLAHPQSRYLVNCRDGHGKGKRLARLPCPGPRRGTWIQWPGRGSLAASGPPTFCIVGWDPSMKVYTCFGAQESMTLKDNFKIPWQLEIETAEERKVFYFSTFNGTFCYFWNKSPCILY